MSAAATAAAKPTPRSATAIPATLQVEGWLKAAECFKLIAPHDIQTKYASYLLQTLLSKNGQC
jgi:hypothetical protein